MFGKEEVIFPTLVDIHVVDLVTGHVSGSLFLHVSDECVDSAQARVENFSGLEIEGRGRVADLDISGLLFPPGFFKVEFLSKDLKVFRVCCVAPFRNRLDVVYLRLLQGNCLATRSAQSAAASMHLDALLFGEHLPLALAVEQMSLSSLTNDPKV